MAKETLPGGRRPTPRPGTPVRGDKPNAAPPAERNQDQLFEAGPDQGDDLDVQVMPIDDTNDGAAPVDWILSDQSLEEAAIADIEPPTTWVAPQPVPVYRPRPTLRQRLARIGWESWAFMAIFLVGAIMRLWGLGDKPLHHDESLHAYFSLQYLLNPSGYLYDPLLHGPFQFHLIPFFYQIGALLHLSGGGANDFTVRLLPALMGTAMVAMPYWLRHQLGRFGALATALLLAVTPSFVYFSRFVRDDIYVTCFTLLMVVGAIQYSQTRHFGALLTVVASLVLSYTAMENTFFIIAIFGSFLVGLVLWDLGPVVGRQLHQFFLERDQPLAGRIVLLVPFLLVMGGAALFGLRKLGELSNTINSLAATHPSPTDPLNPDTTIQAFEDRAVTVLLFVSVVIALAVIVALLVRASLPESVIGPDGLPVSSTLRYRTNPRTQPVLDTLVRTHWIRWFICFVVAWGIFAAFFWKIPAKPFDLIEWNNGFKIGNGLIEWGTGFRTGVGRGLLQGIYYWLEQQHVARGGQPWYYYLILLPLYEPLVLVFGLAGIVRALIQPTRFRIFLVYWFVTTLLLYSWAGEKMPWLIVHIALPLIILSGLAFDWIFSTLVRGARTWWQPTRILTALGVVLLVVGVAATSVALTMGLAIVASVGAILALGTAVILEQWSRRRLVQHTLHEDATLPAPHWMVGLRQGIAAGCLVLAVVLLIPTLWNTQRLVYAEPSVAPNEMLIYVQTTTDVQKVMDKINTLDQQLYHGQHQLHIGVTGAAVWPFAWYLHDYPNTLYSYTANANGAQPEVILADIDEGGAQNATATVGKLFTSHQYRLRWWWDESYKLPPCTGTKTTQCTTQPGQTWGTGVGPFEWITYGAYPPTTCQDQTKPQCNALNAPLNGALAAGRYWNWLWLRQNISGTQPGSTDFSLFVRNDLLNRVQP